MIFVYDWWNRDHIGKHGVHQADAEYVVANASSPYPRKQAEEKFLVWGPDRAGRIVEVVFAVKACDDIEFDTVDLSDLGELSDNTNAVGIYLIHAMPLDGRRLKQYHRNRR